MLVSGTIGDGGLGLEAARGGLPALSAADQAWLADRYRLPQPRLGLRQALRDHATAAADVSDGLIADAGHIAEASGGGVEIDLDRLPLSDAAAAWLAGEADDTVSRCASPRPATTTRSSSRRDGPSRARADRRFGGAGIATDRDRPGDSRGGDRRPARRLKVRPGWRHG